MEVVYAKLYDRYAKLKANKFTEMDEVNKAQEEKFVQCVAVAEELMEFLKKENDDLRNENIQLRKEMASMGASTDEKLAEYQELLMEEDRKNRELSIEIVKLKNKQPEGSYNKNQRMSNGTKSRKRGRTDVDEEECMLTPVTHQEAGPVAVLCVDSMSNGNPVKTLQVPSTNTGAGTFEDDVRDLYKSLLECLLGMKITTVSQKEGLVVSALHESTGYTISMKTVNFGCREESELFFHVVSLGTLERVAADCMKEDIILSKTMIPIFFETAAIGTNGVDDEWGKWHICISRIDNIFSWKGMITGSKDARSKRRLKRAVSILMLINATPLWTFYSLLGAELWSNQEEYRKMVDKLYKKPGV